MKKYLQKFDTLGLVLLVVAALWYSVSNIWEKWNIGLVIAGGVFLIIGVAANYRQIIGTLGKRSTKYASNYVISLVLVIALVSGLNYIGQRHTKRIDTTSNRYFSLSPQTIQILNKLNKDLDIKAFYPGGESADLKELLTEYKTASQRVKYKFVDPDKQSELAKQSGVNSYGTVQNPLTGQTFKFGTVVISYGDKKEKIEKQTDPVQEQDITNAIIKLDGMNPRKFISCRDTAKKTSKTPIGLAIPNLRKVWKAKAIKLKQSTLSTQKESLRMPKF